MIRLDDVSVTYPGGIKALHPTSVEFSRGRFTVLLGPSGAGKSTLLRSINFLCRPTTGTVVVDGLGSLSSDKALREYRRQTGMIFQHHHLIGRQSVLRNVLVGRIGYHSTFRSLLPLPSDELTIGLECLDRVGLLHKALERAEALSGGEQQRVGIARALAQRPKLILADEPVASLDPSTAMKVLSLLYSICEEQQITAIVSLHQVDLARDFADRIIGISRGRIVFDGGPEDLTPIAFAAIYGGAVIKKDSATFGDNAEKIAVCRSSVSMEFQSP